ncbi:glycine-rich protein [Sporosarcina sp. FSL K6-1508]|uniref:glycine-rich protein n=1 Tax=Sporosarcina sp. FSL K6-1508 TaxID=2921553 RepID=UPI0030FC9A18
MVVVGKDAQGRLTYTFAYTKSIESWTVPVGVKEVRIKAIGGSAKGGTSPGGKGAVIEGDITLVPGEKIKVLVGQNGTKATGRLPSPGAGGTYVVRGTQTPLIIAGGGGGNNGYASSATSDALLIPGAGAGVGGKRTSSDGSTCGDGGGGLIGNGTGYTTTQQAMSFINGGQGAGNNVGDGLYGAFGGGGSSNPAGAGGGGGYNGGNGGWFADGGNANKYGLGGSSYNAGTNATAVLSDGLGDGVVIITALNAAPTLTLNTPSNATLYENDTFKIDGNAKDTDIGNVVNVYYRINSGTSRAIATGISTGAALSFNEQLTIKGGKLYKGATAITGALAEGTAHRLEVWSEDNQGGKSVVAERTFYVVPNRAPALTVDPFTDQADMINNDKITLSGTSSDPDGNDVTVKYRINEQAAVQIHSGVAGPWSFDLSLKSLKDGENTIVVEVTDTYNFKSSRTIKLNKHANLTPLASSTQRYTIVPPSGSAQGVLLWIQRDADQEVTAEISMTTGTEQEQFVPLPLENSAPVGEDVEDYFKFRADTPAEHIALKFSWTGDKPITLISGALLQ